MYRFAAIDIGSNAVRLMVAQVVNNGGGATIKKESFFRVPLRLGSEVFQSQRLSPRLQSQLLKTMEGFCCLIEVFEPLGCRACATSAMRDAENGLATVALIAQATGLKLEIIDGQQEAQLLFSSQIQQKLAADKAYLFIDVGGGSTELLLYDAGKIQASASFNIGTVRMLNHAVLDKEWKRMRAWIKQHVCPLEPIGIGSGGNINRLCRMVKREQNHLMDYSMLKDIHAELSKLTIDERMKIYGLKPDRADVIVPAGSIYLSVMKWAKIRSIYVPKSGLCDGLIRQQYEDYIICSPPASE